jgi:hypothetical protein
MNSIGTPEVTQLVANISAIYVPQLVVGYTPVRLQFIVLLGRVNAFITGMLQ